MERQIPNPLLILFGIVVFLPSSSLAESPVPFKTIHLENKCGFPVWPVMADSMAPSLNTTKKALAVLQSGKVYKMDVDPFWSGSIWGMVGCVEKKPCDNLSNMYATKATFELLGGIAKPDTFSVTLENGYNLPISVVPQSSKSDSKWKYCASMGCTVNAENLCPKSLQVKREGRGGVFTACKGRCDGYLCSPPEFSASFRKACPRAFPFSDSAAICPPSTLSYTLTFCPSPRL